MNNEKKKIKPKIRFYFMSLWLLFIFITIVMFVKPDLIGNETIKDVIILYLKTNVSSIISFALSIISISMTLITRYEWKGVNNPPCEITDIKNENYEYLTFLTTYTIPLICINFDDIRYVIVLVLLIVVIGIVFVKMDLYYGNPTLALLGYKIYRVKIKGFDAPDGVIVITKNKLTKGTSIKWIPLDKYLWVAKEIK